MYTHSDTALMWLEIGLTEDLRCFDWLGDPQPKCALDVFYRSADHRPGNQCDYFAYASKVHSYKAFCKWLILCYSTR